MRLDAQPTDTEPTVEIHRVGPDAALVVLGGEHDLQSASAVERAAVDALSWCSHLIVDISAVQFIDSSIVSLLVGISQDAAERGCRFNLVLGTTPIVRRTLEICGVLPALNRVTTVDAALAAEV